jgi:hypothetical protein
MLYERLRNGTISLRMSRHHRMEKSSNRIRKRCEQRTAANKDAEIRKRKPDLEFKVKPKNDKDTSMR